MIFADRFWRGVLIALPGRVKRSSRVLWDFTANSEDLCLVVIIAEVAERSGIGDTLKCELGAQFVRVICVLLGWVHGHGPGGPDEGGLAVEIADGFGAGEVILQHLGAGAGAHGL